MGFDDVETNGDQVYRFVEDYKSTANTIDCKIYVSR